MQLRNNTLPTSSFQISTLEDDSQKLDWFTSLLQKTYQWK